MALDFDERFKRRSMDLENVQYRWADRTPGMDGLFYLETQFDDPITGDPCWTAKSIDRLPFKAQIDPAIIKPRRDNNFSRYEISFHINPPNRDWYFGLKKAFTGVAVPPNGMPKTCFTASDFPIIDAETHRSDGEAPE
ncbi:MAG: hypothetical protein Q9198_011370 [Flavoplaca austrocitrina]